MTLPSPLLIAAMWQETVDSNIASAAAARLGGVARREGERV